MNITLTTSAAIQSGPAPSDSTQMPAGDTACPSFENLLSQTRRDASEGTEDDGGKQPRKEGGRKEIANSSPQDAVWMMSARAQQILSAPLLPTAVHPKVATHSLARENAPIPQPIPAVPLPGTVTTTASLGERTSDSPVPAVVDQEATSARAGTVASSSVPSSPPPQAEPGNRDSRSTTFAEQLPRTTREGSERKEAIDGKLPRNADVPLVVTNSSTQVPVVILTPPAIFPAPAVGVLVERTTEPTTPGTVAPNTFPASAGERVTSSLPSSTDSLPRTARENFGVEEPAADKLPQSGEERIETQDSSTQVPLQIANAQVQQVVSAPLPATSPANPALAEETTVSTPRNTIATDRISASPKDNSGGSVTARQSAQGAITPHGLRSPSPEESVQQTGTDHSEGNDISGSNRPESTASRAKPTNSWIHDTTQFIEAQQILAVPLQTAAPIDAAPGNRMADSGVPETIRRETIAGSAGEGGKHPAKPSASLPVSIALPDSSSEKSPTALPFASPTASSASDGATDTATNAEPQEILAPSDSKSPAKFSAGTTAAGEDRAGDQTIFPVSLNKISLTGADGTPVARERRDMQEHPKEQPLKPSANAVATAFATDPAVVAKLSPVLERASASRRIDAEPITAPASVPTPADAIAFRIQGAAPMQMADQITPAPTPAFQNATHLVKHTMELAEQVSVKGGDRVELQVRMVDGKEVSVSLHLANGEWKPVFKTETPALCQALEQSWQQTAMQSPDRSVRFGTPVFESTQSQAGLGDNTSGQPDAHARNFARQEQADIFPAFPNRQRPSTATSAELLTPTDGIRLYA